MTRESANKYLDVIIAFANGAEIQAKNMYGIWCDIDEPLFSHKNEYRVKTISIEEWLITNDDGWVADWSDRDKTKYYVVFNYDTNEYIVNTTYYIRGTGLTYMSRENAYNVAKALNDGTVVE